MTAQEQMIRENWEQIKEHVRDEYGLSAVSYTTWIKNLTLDKVENGSVMICIPSDQYHALNYISSKYSTYFKITITELMNENFEVSFVLASDKEEEPEAEAGEEGGISFESAGLNPKYRFDNFVVGNNNKFAQSACLAVAESPGEAYNPLFLYGGAGLGKTHLMHSIGRYVLEENPSKKVLYVTSEQFTNEVIESIRSGASNMARFRDKYRTVDVLLIDDIQFIIGKESTQEEFFHTFNVLHSAGKQIVISSDRPPKEMETLDERFRSRFEWGLIADLQAPDYETRMAILRKNAEDNDMYVTDDALEFIANNIRSNIRELEGALKKLSAYAKLNNIDDITVDTTKEALKDIITTEGSETVTPSLIARTVCDHYGVRLSNVASRKKNAELVLPRQIIMYICREYTNETYENIGKLLSKKDHSTVIYGVDRIKEQLEKSEELRNNVEIILKKLNIEP